MRYSSIVIIFILLFQPESSAQITPGARQVSLSHSDIALSNDDFSIFKNPAGLAQINWREIGIYYSFQNLLAFSISACLCCSSQVSSTAFSII